MGPQLLVGVFFGVDCYFFLFLLRLGGLVAQHSFGAIFSIFSFLWVDLFVEGFVQFPSRVLCNL